MIRLPAPSNAFTRRMLAGHGWLGLVFGALLYILCFTGTLLVLVDQLSRWEQPDVPRVSVLTDDRLAAIVQRAEARARIEGRQDGMILRLPSPELPRLTVLAYADGRQPVEWAVDAQGRMGDRIQQPFVAFAQAVHFNLTAPGAIGRYLVGIFGMVLLASIATGILAHRRIFKDAFRLRWGGARRRSNAELHNRIGLWALPFHLVVSLTGSLLGLSGLILLILALIAYRGDQQKALVALLGPQPTEDARPAALPPLAPMLAEVRRQVPGAEITQVQYQHFGTRGQLAQLAVAAPGHLARNETFTFSGEGRLLGKIGFTDGSAGMRLYGMITPLHYGTYGGLPLKLIYVALGAGLTLIVATGGAIWLGRRREQGRAAPRLERVWPAILWGQPVALLLAALASMAGLPGLPIYWGAALGAVIAALATSRAEMVAAWGRRVTFALAAALSLLHLALVRPADPVALAIDAALVAPGLWFALRAGLRRYPITRPSESTSKLL